MKKHLYNRAFTIILWSGWLILWGIILWANKPHNSTIQMTTDGTNWVTVTPVAKFSPCVYVIPCKVGQFFRICSDAPTRITDFVPDTNGLAVITFTYTK